MVPVFLDLWGSGLLYYGSRVDVGSEEEPSFGGGVSGVRATHVLVHLFINKIIKRKRKEREGKSIRRTNSSKNKIK